MTTADVHPEGQPIRQVGPPPLLGSPAEPVVVRVVGKVADGLADATVAAVEDVGGAWFWRSAPPSLRDLAKDRMADSPFLEKLDHRCFDRSDPEAGFVEISPGWKCVCAPIPDEVRKSNNTHIRAIRSWRILWIIYNHLVALPATAVAYVLIWIVQHPARLFFAGSLALVAVGVVFG